MTGPVSVLIRSQSDGLEYGADIRRTSCDD